MTPGDVLLCLSLTNQRQAEIHDRLSTRGHLVSPQQVQRALATLTADGLAVMEKGLRASFYRLAEGPSVDAALDVAWAGEL